jgi:hypothetical protein
LGRAGGLFGQFFSLFLGHAGLVFLQGVLRNRGGKLCFFCGQFVVKCVVKDGWLMVMFPGRKICQSFQLYLSADLGTVGDLPLN